MTKSDNVLKYKKNLQLTVGYKTHSKNGFSDGGRLANGFCVFKSMSLSRHQQHFVDTTIHHPAIKKAMSSPHEYDFKKILNAVGREGKDWFHQSAYYEEECGLVAVPDFVFPKERLIIELDDSRHKQNYQKQRDIERDKVFKANDFSVVRIKVPIPEDKKIYWKVFIEEMLKICRDEIKKQQTSKKYRKKFFSKKEFEEVFKRKLNKSIKE